MQALIEFQNDNSYDDQDLAVFVEGMGIPNITVNHIVGPFNQTFPDAESTLDVQYGGAISLNTSVWFWTEQDWMYAFISFPLNFISLICYVFLFLRNNVLLY